MEQHDLHHLTDMHKGENCKVRMFCLTFSRDFNISSLTSGVPGKQRSAVISSKFEFITLNFELIAEKNKKKKKNWQQTVESYVQAILKFLHHRCVSKKGGKKVKERERKRAGKQKFISSKRNSNAL